MVCGPRRTEAIFALLLFLAFVPPLTSCGGDAPVGPDTDLEFLVGDWDATRFVVQSNANPEVAPELIAGNVVEFSLNVQPSGQYTSVLIFERIPDTQIGLLQVDGDEIIFHRSFPSPEDGPVTVHVFPRPLDSGGRYGIPLHPRKPRTSDRDDRPREAMMFHVEHTVHRSAASGVLG